MRLSKRLAIGILAAMMALSMSACKPSEQPPASSSTGNQPSTSTPSASSGSNSNSSSVASSGSSSSASSGSDSRKDDVKEQTRADKFFSGRYIMNNSKWTYTVQRTDIREGGQLAGDDDVIEIVATDGRRWAIQWIDGDYVSTELGDEIESKNYEIIHDPSHNWNEVKITNVDNKYNQTLYGYLGDDVLWQGAGHNQSISERADKYETGVRKIGGASYYSEVYTKQYESGLYEEDIYCFDPGDTEGKYLRYYIHLRKSADGAKVMGGIINKVTNIGSTFDAALLQVPEGYEMSVRNAGDIQYKKLEEKTPKDNYPN